MIADVPVGILLSGGVDSTGVLSLAVDEPIRRSVPSPLVLPGRILQTRGLMQGLPQRGLAHSTTR